MYDEYGVLKTIPVINIPIGSVVEYTDTKVMDRKSVKIKLVGIWDGKKVEFNDKDKTIVRTTRWLKLLKS